MKLDDLTKVMKQINLQCKTTSNGTQPRMEDCLTWMMGPPTKTTSNGIGLQMEDDLQMKITSNERQPPKEDNHHMRMTSNEI